MPSLEALLSRRRTVFFDGAMGTMLQRAGLLPGERSDMMNIRAPEAVFEIHRAYVDAGSDIILTNTLGANAHALSESGHSPKDVIEAAVASARRAANGRALVALDVGPVGELMEPHGALTPEDAYKLFREQIEAGASAGAELVAVETMSDLDELSAAVTASRDACALPVLAMMTFGSSGRTYTGVAPADFVRRAEALGVAALGINCSLEPRSSLPVFRELAAISKTPLIAKLNAGLPDSDGRYGLTPEEFAGQMLEYKALGVRIAGACCGSTPEFIRALVSAFAD
ncbi:MAG: homocysteine S-methyltransferase family protein [Oscillospiraceae bacterium]|nr:homocysteine S-methyltransferase family protein [Oscillospiraceae bacterium]